METSPRLLWPPLQPAVPNPFTPLSVQTARPALFRLRASDGTKEISKWVSLSPVKSGRSSSRKRGWVLGGRGSNEVAVFPETVIFIKRPLASNRYLLILRSEMYEKADRFVPLSFLKGVGSREDTHPVLPGAQQVMEGPGSPQRSLREGDNCPWFCMSFGVSSAPRCCKWLLKNCKQLPHAHRDHLIDTGFSTKNRNSFLFSLW